MPTTVEAPVLLRCSSCGDSFELSARRARVWRGRGGPLCRRCQTPPRELTEEERARYRRWWLERSGLSLEELREIGAMIWPDDAAAAPGKLAERAA